MIYHVWTQYEPKDPEAIRRQRLAQLTWPRQQWEERPIRDEDLPRLFKENDRAFPYIKDLFDLGTAGTRDEDIIVYTNSDIMVRGDACPLIVARMQDVDALYTYRRDFHHRVESPIPDHEYVKGIQYAGSDLKAFRAGWWRYVSKFMPDMLVGNEAYDPVLRQLIEETNDGPHLAHLPDIICHERHGSYWENPANRYRLRSQLHNLGLARQFFMMRGINPGRYGIP